MAGSCCSAKRPVGPQPTESPPSSVQTSPKRTNPKSRNNSDGDKKPSKVSQIIDEQKRYACVSCVKGHRTEKCTHGRQRPIAPTNTAGRPAAGSKRKCACPKNCACHNKKTCKCEPNCVCVQTMYFIVHVSKKEPVKKENEDMPEYTVSFKNKDGDEVYLQTVLADRQGRLLDETEVQNRREQQEKREQMEHVQKQEPTPTPSTTTVPQQVPSPLTSNSTSRMTPLPTPALSTPIPACHPTGCGHASNINNALLPTLQAAQGCNCGNTCQCIHCPQHANNAATLQYNQEQFAQMARSSLFPPSIHQHPSGFGPIFRPETPLSSCMGGPTSFRLTSQMPNPQEVRQMFPDAEAGSFFMQYPVMTSRYPEPMETNQQQFQPDIQMDFNNIDMSGWGDVQFGDGDVLQFSGPDMQSVFQPNAQVLSPRLPSLQPQHHITPVVSPPDEIFDVPMADFGNANGFHSPPNLHGDGSVHVTNPSSYEPPTDLPDDAWLDKFTNFEANTDPYMGYHVPTTQPTSPIMTRGS
jgi:hypothetical protein